MGPLRTTIVGGTGFLGRRLADRLVSAGHRVCLVSRHEAVDLGNTPGGRLEGVRADVLEPESLRPAVATAEVVFNLVGAVSLPSTEAYFDLHEHGARNVAQAARDPGAARLIHISALGVDPGAPSAADRSKAAGEAAVRAVFPQATLVRPSLLFGEGDHFFSRIEAISRRSPVLPLIGADTGIQPLHVDDLAEALLRMAERPDTAGLIYEAGGPGVYRLSAAVELLLRSLGRSRLLLPVSLGTATRLASLVDWLPNPPLTQELVDLMRTDKIVAPGALGLADLGVWPRSLESWLGLDGR